ncbi:MAG: hypothetical protein K8I60_08855 [Anaerolineae bacterium]|nr:hypothetical protein [Anaerolineae bacterium]
MDGLKSRYDEQVFVQHVDIDDPANARIVSRYSAISIPLVVIFNDRGEVVAIYEGFQTEGTLRRGIDDALRESTFHPTT